MCVGHVCWCVFAVTLSSSTEAESGEVVAARASASWMDGWAVVDVGRVAPGGGTTMPADVPSGVSGVVPVGVFSSNWQV